MQKKIIEKVENVKKIMLRNSIECFDWSWLGSTFWARWIERVPYFWQSKPGSLLREIDRLSSLKQDDGEGEGEGEEDEKDPKNSSQFWEGSSLY